MIFLETQRLLFRTHEPGDEDDFVQMQTDSEVRRYMGARAWPLEKALYRFRTEYLAKPTKTYGLWATILKDENKYIGCCGLRSVEVESTVHLGYLIARSYWRRGFASEAAAALIDVAFTRLRLHRLLANVEKGNVVSEHILTKFGFTSVGLEEIQATGRVILVYELSKKTWESGKCRLR